MLREGKQKQHHPNKVHPGNFKSHPASAPWSSAIWKDNNPNPRNWGTIQTTMMIFVHVSSPILQVATAPAHDSTSINANDHRGRPHADTMVH